MSSCEKAKKEPMTSLTNKEVLASESCWIKTILEAYYKACHMTDIFISQNSTEVKTCTLYDKPGTTSGIRLEKLKFNSFVVLSGIGEEGTDAGGHVLSYFIPSEDKACSHPGTLEYMMKSYRV